MRRADAVYGNASFALTIYWVLRLDRVQNHGYVVRVEGSDVEKRVDLDPAK